MNPYVSVNVDKTNRIANIEFYHPKGNSLDSKLLDELVNVIDDLNNNDGVNSLVISSSGDKVFCSGASFDELLQVDDLQTAEHFFSGFARLILAVKNSNKIVIGKISGKTVGGGVGLMAAMDYVIANESASVKLSELALGIGPYVIAPAIERKIGLSALQELSYNSTKWKDAKWALSKGLISEIAVDNLDNTVLDFAMQYKGYSGSAISELKRFYWSSNSNWEVLLFENAKITARLCLTDFTKKLLSEFKQKK